jgi:hypothetical protein
MNSEGGGSGGSSSSSSSGADYSAELESIHHIIGVLSVLPKPTSVRIIWAELVQGGEKIPKSINCGALTLLNNDMAAVKDKVYTLPILPNLPQESLTWQDVISAVKKIPSVFGINALQELYDEVYYLKDNIVLFPQIQYLCTAVTELDSADCSLETISYRLEQMQ